MQDISKLFAALTTGALLMSSSVAFAQTNDTNTTQQQPQGPRPGMMMGGQQGQKPPLGKPGMGAMGSSTGQRPGMPGMNGSTTGDRMPGKMGSSTGEMPRGVPGVVTAVGTDSFTMTGRGMGENASTSITVKVTSNTKYMKIGMPMQGQRPDKGSTTPKDNVMWNASSTGQSGSPLGVASLTEIKVGSKVEVIGMYDKTAKSITATLVIIGNANGQGGQQQGGNGQGQKTGVMQKLKTFFNMLGGKNTMQGGEAGQQQNGGPAAAIWNLFFGWLK